MDKKEFLSGLERSLSVLQEDELRDIISEYEQHIDMKVEKGLTEEEAIADFGSFEELTAELLEAYHVRADYVSDMGKTAGGPGREGREKSKEILNRLKKAGGGLSMGESLKKAGKGILSKARWVLAQCIRPFSWIKRQWERQKNGMGDIQKRKEGKKMSQEAGRGIRAGAGMLGRFFVRVFDLAVDVILWGLRIAWNGCWFLFSLFMTGCGLFGLYCLGVIIILMMQGYPLTGVMLGCLGIVLCTFSAAGLGISFLWRKKETCPVQCQGEGMTEVEEKRVRSSRKQEMMSGRMVSEEAGEEEQHA